MMWPVVAIVLFCVTLPSVSAQKPELVFRWPDVIPEHRQYYFPDASKAAVNLSIRGTNKQELYWLECRSGGQEGARGFDFSGDFHCWMGEPLNHWDLLHDDLYEDKPWWSRGRFLANELWGDCQDYPEWGAVRTFRMRGMLVVLKMSQLHFAPSKYPVKGTRTATHDSDYPRLLSFGFEVKVSPDPTALAAQAEPPAFAEPTFRRPHNRDEVLRNCETPRTAQIPGRLEAADADSHKLSPPYPVVSASSARFYVRRGPPQHGRFVFSKRPNAAGAEELRMTLRSPSGQILYEFKCEGMSISWQTRWITVCSLTRPGDPTNLLEHAIDLYSRRGQSVVLPQQLIRNCAAYPEFGGVRIFRLRNMKVKMQFDQIAWEEPDEMFLDNPGLKSAVLTISVEPAVAPAPLGTPTQYIWPEFHATYVQTGRCGQVLRAPQQDALSLR